MGRPKAKIATAHRLNFKAPNSTIYVRFAQLHERNAWMKACSEKLKPEDMISIIPDIPPVLRDVRANLLDRRRSIRTQEHRRAHLKYLPDWPFMRLVAGDPGEEKEEINPEEDMDEILEIYLGLRKRLVREKKDAAATTAADRDQTPMSAPSGAGHAGARGRGGYRGGPRAPFSR